MRVLLQVFRDDPDFQAVVDGFARGLREQMVTGLSGSARPLYVATLYRAIGRPVVLVTHNTYHAQRLYEDLAECLPEEEVWLYPANEVIGTEVLVASPEMRSQRLKILTELSAGKTGVLVVPYAGLCRRLPPPAAWREAVVRLAVGDTVDLEAFARRLSAIGYTRTEMIEAPGEFSVRGGIVDVFPLSEPSPLRIEFFDDEVDSIRAFDVETQRSTDARNEAVIPPVAEVFATPERRQQGALRLEDRLNRALETIRDPAVRDKLRERIGWELEQWRQGAGFQGEQKYVELLYPEAGTLLDYVAGDPLLVFDEPARVFDAVDQLEKDEAEWQTALVQAGEFLPRLRLTKAFDETVGRRPRLYLALFLRQVPRTHPQNVVNVVCRSMQNFHGQMNVLKTEMARWEKSDMRVLFAAADEERAGRLARVLADYGMEVDVAKDLLALPKRPTILIGNLSSGFELPRQKVVVVTESEVFTQKQRKARRVATISGAERIKSYLDLKVGDYVVHVNHGIGKYMGIQTLEVDGVHKDYLLIQYAGNDKLYVPIDQIDLVQKYIGAEDKEPKIYSLGGGEWKKVKNRVRASVRDIAEDLLKLYAKRQASKGYAFSKDTPEQREFEALFPYEETPDQLRAIEEVKRDMEAPRPMDRLLCGDVGYGKTEVAIRAAFKAVMDGKQVAVLVPTTILAQQHFETFKERFADYPVRIEVLSRFRSRKEQNQVIKGLKDGTVDIVIGTHRLLSKDVQFKDLGLLIIDEEQRFGVAHKEKLKQLKTNVDVLTLTATPIPRTLHMSMLGVRDLSVIETPPENRFPVQTYVVEYSAALVREAIERELARGGQVYFVYNQVQSIERMADQIRALVPDARVAVAHGQMDENELERVMLDFLDGQYDVLVCTTIIETGVDIPNVNTLIVYDADKLGLAQLYQLRGRVGRSNRIAYAYFTYQRDKVLSEEAEKRLQAIKEFTEFGSGFKIAMRDLAIRGAGNLLGPEQHGFIASVGFDLYTQMLKEAIEELKGEKPEEPPLRPEIDLAVDAYLPSDYIPDAKQKIEMYKKFAAVENPEEVPDLVDELVDRFGEPSPPVKNLLSVVKIRTYAARYRMERIVQKGDEVRIDLAPDQTSKIDGGRLFALAARFDRRIALSMDGGRVGIRIPVKGLSAEALLSFLERFLEGYADVLKTKGEVKHVAT
ncbi:transcription-repair coupling factor [Calditerricola satsumensis]|uniref:Transcription-repair-coupling factor n=1 Tax=Calditerricola satsumensis TaxID=373054 RepID=A0A8J3BGQ6_9BACI|nr:transcription-repair coupling factor [Calditerricola satsumensis]GGK06597.1 transcription-repair-coupling factor [Calditerricola satsumensis]